MKHESPIIKVEFEYADGRVQRLTGTPAQAWLEEVNNIIAQAHIRYSRAPMSEFDWEWTTRDEMGDVS